MVTPTRTNRIVTNEEIKNYDSLVEFWLSKSVIKNWTEASLSRNRGHVTLGNSGYTMDDIRQHLRCEVLIALKNYDNTHGTKESTFVYGHLSNRIGSLMKRLTKPQKGYGAWVNNLEIVLHEVDAE